MTLLDDNTDSRGIALRQRRFEHEEFRRAVRALLMDPLMNPVHEDFTAVRHHKDALREWFSRETGWTLRVERDGARLYKRPADLTDGTRGLPDYDRRHYVLLCLACAVLERPDPQITLHVLGERLITLAAEPAFVSAGFRFALDNHHQRRELVAVCRTLLDLGILQRLAGDEDSYVTAGGDKADALYDVHRRTLAGMLAASRGPSTWRPEDAPVTLDQRLRALVEEHVADSDEGRRTALRHHLARRLLDDPVVYTETLDEEARAYFINQRGAMALRLCEASGLVAEQRSEGTALVDEAGQLTDVAMPAEGTDSHITLLTAEFLASSHRRQSADHPVSDQEVADHLRATRDRFGRYWRKSAREPGSEHELAGIALKRLEMLSLIARHDGRVIPRPALARFALGEAEVRQPTARQLFAL